MILVQGIKVSDHDNSEENIKGMHGAMVIENRTSNAGAGDSDIILDQNQNLDFKHSETLN